MQSKKSIIFRYLPLLTGGTRIPPGGDECNERGGAVAITIGAPLGGAVTGAKLLAAKNPSRRLASYLLLGQRESKC
jgi:hypothetical protein